MKNKVIINIIEEKLQKVTGEKHTFHEFCKMVKRRDVDKVMREMVDDIAVALVSGINILHPQLVILANECIDWDDKYVYLLYSGKTAREADVRAYEGTVVYRLTWEGHPVDKLELDWPATRICVSPDDSVLYSLANKGETEIVQYLLKNIV